MTENIETIEASGIESKFTKVTLTVIAVLLVFVGPTYIPYLLSDVLHADYFAAIGTGLVLFIVGLVMIVYLIRKKVIT
jgi:Na+-driven multidrug efflux pump